MPTDPQIPVITPEPSTTSTPPATSNEPVAPPPSANDFGSGGPDVEGAVSDILGFMDADEPSPSERSVAPQEPAVTPQVIVPSSAPAPVSPAAPAAPVAAPAVAPAPAPQAPVPVVATPEQPPAVAAPAQTPEQQSAAPTPPASPVSAASAEPFAALSAAVQAQRAALEGSLAELYTPNAKEMEEFHEAPEKVLGKLAARLHMEVVQNTLGVLAQNVPSAVVGVIQAQKLNDGYEAEFYQRWPQLNRNNAQHREVLMQIARAYAKANPNTDAKTRITQIGAQAIVALNLLPAQVPSAPVATAQRPAPFAPAGNGSAAPIAPAQLQGWEAINQALDLVDTGD